MARRLPEALSVRKAAEVLGVHDRTVRRWIRLGHLKAYRIAGFSVRIPRSEVSRLRRVRLEFGNDFRPDTMPTV